MKTKLPYILGLYFLVLILDSCGVDCNCPPVLPFFDYQQLDITALPQNDTGTTDAFYFDVYPAEYDFLAIRRSWNLGLLNSAYACSCVEGGEQGAKFPISDIKILCDQDWNADYPAGEDLKSLFNLRPHDPDMNTSTPLDSVSVYPLIDLYQNPILLSTTVLPDSIGPNISYGLSIEFTKSNGNIADGQVDIIWE